MLEADFLQSGTHLPGKKLAGVGSFWVVMKSGLAAAEQITRNNCKRRYPQLLQTATRPRSRKGKPSGTPQHYRAVTMLSTFSRLKNPWQGRFWSHILVQQYLGNQVCSSQPHYTPSTPVHQVKKETSTGLRTWHCKTSICHVQAVVPGKLAAAAPRVYTISRGTLLSSTETLPLRIKPLTVVLTATLQVRQKSPSNHYSR